MSDMVYSARDGYNIIAEYYDDWKWQKFWKAYEYPVIEEWARTLQKSNGLDAGTGTGNNLSIFLEKGHTVTALDISRSMLYICMNKYQPYIIQNKLNCIEFDLLNLIELRSKYDWIICNRVLSNISNIEIAFRLFAATIKSKGECLISDVHPLHEYESTNLSYSNNKIVIETFKHPLIKLEKAIEENNFIIVEKKEFTYKDLPKTEILSDFSSLKNQKVPIFFYYILRKQ